MTEASARRGTDVGETLRWRVVVDRAPTSGALNMALDHALAELLRPGTGVLRLYSWAPHAISFGRNEPTEGRYDIDAAWREGVTFVRRPTGGRALLHADEVTYAVSMPVRALSGVRTAYARVNEGLVAGLRTLGIPAEVSRDGPTFAPDAVRAFVAQRRARSWWAGESWWAARRSASVGRCSSTGRSSSAGISPLWPD